jgi:hypothetical protein
LWDRVQRLPPGRRAKGEGTTSTCRKSICYDILFVSVHLQMLGWYLKFTFDLRSMDILQRMIRYIDTLLKNH